MKIKDSGEKQKSKRSINNFNAKKFIFIILILMIAMFTIVFANNKELDEILNGKKTSQNSQIKAIGEDTKAIEIGDKAYISDAQVIQTQTGTGPWDADDNPGNDSSEDNEIVRSYDQIIWTVDLTMSLKKGISEISLTGGTVNIEATLPTNCVNLMKWDLNSMTWAENAQISDDGTRFTANYTMSETNQSVPGKQTLLFIVSVGGASNETEITPTFNFKFQGDTDDEKRSTTAKTVKVSSKPKYDISIDNLNMSYDVERNGESKKLYKYGLSFKLLGDNSSKGLKGIETPKENLSFDISYNMQRKSLATSEYTDITNNLSLYNYKYNTYSNNSLGDQNNIISDIPTDFFISAGFYPYSVDGVETNTVYQNGNLKMVDDKNGTIHVTISDFAVGETFPTIVDWGSAISPENGYISVGIFYMSVDLNEETMMQNTQSFIEYEAKNFQVTTIGNNICTEEVKKDNNFITNNLIIGGEGIFGKETYYMQGENILGNPRGNGNGESYIGVDNLAIGNVITTDIKNSKDNWIYDIDILTKFDDKNLEPVVRDNQEYITTAVNGTTDITFNILYAGKKDKKGWTSDDEMINTSMDDLIYFDTLEELKQAGYTCVATLAESQSGNIKSGISLYVKIPVQIKSDAVIGSVSQTLTDVRVYTENNQLDRSIQTHLKTTNVDDYPDPTWKDEKSPYIKTEYDENGQMVTGTHNGGSLYGNSLSILGATQSIFVRSLDENDNEKINFDIGKNENIVKYEVTPAITNKYMSIESNEITIKVEVNLPKGLEYIIGSCDYSEPEIIENNNGTTTLVWYKDKCKINENIEAIKFKAKIDNNSKNGETYNISAIISEIIGSDGISKLGNADVNNRTAQNYINIIDLSSHRAYKDVEESIILKNNVIKYKIVYENKTDNKVPDFQLLDILPYNNDDRGSKFSGTYTIKNINVKQTINDVEQNNDNLKLYVTNSDKVRNINAKDTGIGIDDIWIEKNIGADINEEEKGIALKGNLEGYANVEIEITLQTNNNNADDIYVNNALVQVYKDSEQMETANVEVKVINRSLSGKVWEDSNKNGIIDNNEKGIAGIKVTLINTSNNIEQVTTTNDNGEYIFDALAKDNYKVKIEYLDKYYLTEKGIGQDETVNSKFNVGTNETDEITTLNNIEFTSSEQKNINAGLISKDISSSVLVHYYKEGTTEKLSKDVIINGNVGQDYETHEAQDIPSNYELVKTPTNATGKIVESQTVVIYNYRLKTPEILNSEITKESTVQKIIDKNQAIDYTIEYQTTIDKYIGKVTVTIKDKLEYEIDEQNSNIAGGTYNEEEKTFTWEETIDNIDTFTKGPKDINITKEIKVVYKNLDVTDKNITNKVEGKIELETPNKEETVENTKDIPAEYLIEITVNKVWEDQNDVYGKRPDSINIQVKDGTYIKGEKTIAQDNGWKCVFTGLPKYDDKGQEIQYTVDEEEIKTGDLQYYTKELGKVINSNVNDTIKKETTITNRFSKQTSTVIVKYVDINTNKEIEDRVTKNGFVGEQFDVTEDKKDIEGYTLVKEPEEKIGIYTEKEQEKIYYYAKNTKATVQHIDRETGKILKQETEEGKVGDIFKTHAEDFEGYVLVEAPKNPDVEMTEKEQIVKYYYAHISAGVIEKHIDEITGELLYSEEHKGNEGDSYEIQSKNFEGYDLVEDKIPDNRKGTMKKDLIEVKYYYIKKATVRVEYIDKNTGEKLADDIIIKGYENDNYTTEEKEFENYNLIETPENAKGQMKITVNEDGTYNTETVVKYYYVKQSAGVIEKHIDINTNKILAEETHKGNIGDIYNISSRNFEGYDLVEDKLPTNATGNMSEEEIEVKYYYIKRAEVEMHYVEKDTGIKMAENDKIKGHVGDKYNTKPKEILYYKLVENTSNTEGKMKEEKTTVIYYYEKQIFNLSVDKWISEVSINGVTRPGQNYDTKDQLYKIDIHRNKTSTADIKITYTIRISNTGEIEGTVGEIKELIPQGYSYYQEDNDIYWNGTDGVLTTTALKDETIQPGEYKEIKIVLRWNKGDDNFGQKDNTVILSSVSNPAGYVDINKEDDSDKSEMIISISTGLEPKIKTSVVIGILLCLIITSFVIIKKLKKVK